MNRRPDVTATPLPAQSLLHQRAAPADFLDCYSVASDLPPRQAAEIITGFNDRHLNFRVSVQSREGRVFIATWVHPHNLGGHLSSHR